MSAVGAGVLGKLQDLLPGQIGDNKAYSTAYVNAIILAAHYAVTERTETQFVSEDITLVADTLEYDLSSKFITVASVDFKSDGSIIDGSLTAATMDDFDRLSLSWRDDRGTRPEYYALLSAPGTRVTTAGVPDSRIMIYRQMSAVTSEVITVNGIGMESDLLDSVPNDVQDYCVVPYCMSHLYANRDIKYAMGQYDKFVAGCVKMAGRYLNKFVENPVR